MHDLINITPDVIYLAHAAGLGFGGGFWAIFVTMAAEQFGTNLRATVATTVPNFIRGSLVLIALIYDLIYAQSDVFWASYIVSAMLLLTSFYSLPF